jgi:stage II sporulation protein D
MINTNRTDWDVSDSAASQVYSGLSTETSRAVKAQRSTLGEVLVYGPEGQEEIICTFYSSTCGGGTRPVWELKKGYEHVAPLAGVQINHCEESPMYRWDKRVFSKAKLFSALTDRDDKYDRLETLESVSISKRTPQGRARQILLVGRRSREATIAAEDFRYMLKLPSAWFDIEDHGSKVWFTNGRGLGHGMGMCQFGANGMARHGYRYDEILSTYFPGSKLIRGY